MAGKRATHLLTGEHSVSSRMLYPHTLWLLERNKFCLPSKFESFPRSTDSVAADSRQASSRGELNMMKEEVAFRLAQAETVGLGFALPPKIADVVRVVRKNEARREVENAA